MLARVYSGEAWHGSSLRELLAKVTASQAAARPFPHLHSIWEVVVHAIVWKDEVRRGIEGEELRTLPPEQDWPPVTDTSASAWQKTLDDLEQSQQRLRQALGGLKDEQLRQRVAGKPYSIYGMVHGLIQHDAYHAGQIAVLRNAQTQNA
jgi:hypothetical protein